MKILSAPQWAAGLSSRVIAAALSALLAFGVGAFAADAVVLENDLLRVVFEPDEFPGCAVGFTYKPTGRDLSAFESFRARGGEGPATQRTNLGYLFWREPSEVRHEFVEQTDERTAWTASYRWAEERDGVDYDFRFTALYVLNRGEPRLKVEWTAKNLADGTRNLGIWQKNTMAQAQPGRHFAMTPQGPATVPSDRFFPATTNWFARCGAEGAGGEEIFYTVSEHEKVRELYLWRHGERYTLEKLYAPAVLAPGESWTTKFFIAAGPDLPNVAFASPEGAVSLTPLSAAQPGAVKVSLRVAPAVALGQVRLEGSLTRDGAEVMPLGPRRVNWIPGETPEASWSLTLAEPGAYMVELNVFDNGGQHALGHEVDAYRRHIEIPFTVGELPEGEAAMEAWPREAPAFRPIVGRDLALPVVAEEGAFRVGTAHPTERVFQPDRLAEDAPRADGVERYAAAGEWESVPLYVFPTDPDGLSNFWISVSALEHEGGEAKLGKDDVRVFRVGHVLTKAPSRYWDLPVGRYPDPLFPMEAPVDVPGGQAAGFWVNLRAPLDAAPGTYRGSIRIVSNESRAEIPLTLNVWDFALPSPPALRTWAGAVGFNIRGQMQALGVDDYDAQEIRRQFIRWCLDYGFSPGHGMRYSLDHLTEWRDYNRGWNALNYGNARHALQETDKDLIELGWEGRVLQYAPFDEHSDEAVPQVAEWCRQFRAEAPEHVQILDVYYGANTEPLHGLVDVWCRQFQRDDWTRERMAAGDEFWKVNAHLIWAVEAELFPGRQEYWRIWSYNYTGQLLWSVVAWNPQPPDFRGLGVNAIALNFYPVPGGLTTTIRWENMRDGLEDYDYLAVLRPRADVPGPGAAEEDVARARAILDDPNLHLRITHWSALEERRLEIGRLIERLGK